MKEFNFPDIPEIAKGTVVPIGIQKKILEEEKEEHKNKVNFRFSLISAICGIAGAITGILALIVSILAFIKA